MSVILVSKKRQMQVHNLDTRDMMRRARRIEITTIEEGRDGGHYPRRSKKRVPDSLTIPAMARVESFSDGRPLPDSIVQVPSIARAIKRRELRVIRVQDAKPAKTASAPRPTATTAKKTKKTENTTRRSGGVE